MKWFILLIVFLGSVGCERSSNEKGQPDQKSGLNNYPKIPEKYFSEFNDDRIKTGLLKPIDPNWTLVMPKDSNRASWVATEILNWEELKPCFWQKVIHFYYEDKTEKDYYIGPGTYLSQDPDHSKPDTAYEKLIVEYDINTGYISGTWEYSNDPLEPYSGFHKSLAKEEAQQKLQEWGLWEEN